MNMNSASTRSLADERSRTGSEDYITVLVAGQLLGLPIHRVHDVFVASDMTTVPLAPPEIVGLLNLRGRVVTAVSLRRRLGLPDSEGFSKGMAIGLEHKGESFGLLVDEVGDVLKLDPEEMQPNPVHLQQRWSELSKGVHQLQNRLLIILDVDAVLAFQTQDAA